MGSGGFQKVLVVFKKVLVVFKRFGEVLVVLGSGGSQTLEFTLKVSDLIPAYNYTYYGTFSLLDRSG